MTRTLKFLTAAFAFLAPIAVGWAYTGGATVDAVFGGLDHTVDEWIIDDYLIEREQRDGEVTMTVTDLAGTALPLAELPEDVAAEVEFFRTDWEDSHPSERLHFGTQDGVSCYSIDELELAPGDEVHLDTDDGRVLLMLEASADADGAVTVRAMEWTEGALTESELASVRRGGASFGDLPPGVELDACES